MLEDDLDEAARVGRVLEEFRAEWQRARRKFAPLHGPHEGYAVILEELDEAWDAIKANDLAEARKEMVQIGAMVLAFLLEVPGVTPRHIMAAGAPAARQEEA